MSSRPFYKPRACLTDWDGTLRDGYTLHDWLLYLEKNANLPCFGAEDFNFHLQRFREGEITYDQLLSESYQLHARCVKGYNPRTLAAMTDAFISSDSASLFEFTKDLLHLVHSRGIRIIVISGGPATPLHCYKKLLPIDDIYATEIETGPNGLYTSKAKSTYGNDTAKGKLVAQLSKRFDIVLALGDTLSDAPLLRASQNAFLKFRSRDSSLLAKSIGNHVRELNNQTPTLLREVL